MELLNLRLAQQAACNRPGVGAAAVNVSGTATAVGEMPCTAGRSRGGQPNAAMHRCTAELRRVEGSRWLLDSGFLAI